MQSRRRVVVWTVIGIVAAVLLLSSTAAYYYTEVLWFDELGYLSVFWTILRTRLLVGLVSGLIFGLFLFANLRYVRSAILQLSSQVDELQTGQWFLPRTINRVIVAVSVVFGLLAGISFATEWETVLRYFNQSPFGINDPLYGRDIAYFVFTLPFYRVIFNSVGFLILLTILVMALIYFFAGSVNFLGGRVNVHPRSRRHLAVLLASYLLLKAWGYWLDAYQLVYSPRGVAFGASYTDIHAQLPVFRIMSILAVLSALVALWYIRARDIRWLYAAVGIMLIGSLALGTGYPAAIQRLVVAPNEIARETRFIEYNIAYTRAAFGLDRVEEREFPAADVLTWEDLEENIETVENVRLWDWRPLLASYRQLHTIRAYYEFPDADVDRYTIDGRYQQVLIAARELDYERVPGAETWVNQRLQYTHGHGVVMSPAAQFTPEGQPVMYIQDIPPTSEVDIEVANPAIYYGEMTQAYVITNTREPELHYPMGAENVYIHYDGTGGVAFEGLLRRSLFALRFSDYNILLSGSITPESRVMYYRHIGQRVRRLAPFLMYDDDPYVVLSREEGRMFWIQDAYTHTTRYPYSEPYRHQLNYIRNSVKVVIDAYNGDVTFYVFDEEDPLIRTYMNMFPDLFRSKDEMPGELQGHVRYPEGLFQTQMDMYRTYHMQDPVVFYNKEDLWEYPEEIFAGQPRRMEPYYILMDLPGDDSRGQEFILMTPFTPSQRDVMISWVAGRSDGDQYGDLLVYKMPKGKTVLGPRQIEARIDQDAEISQLFTLWGQSGSRVIRGNLLVIPIKDALLYVEPVYLEAADTALPELRRVIAAYGNRVAMGRDLSEAMEILFGVRPPLEDPTEDPDDGVILPDTDVELIGRAWQLFQGAQEALRAGQWARYGELMSQLEAILEQLAAEMQEPSPAE